MQLRDYQLRHVALVESGNTIVLLPTGAGKTLVAAEAVNRVCQNNKPALFLVPTCMLVTQQADAVRDWTERNVAEYMGGMALPTAFDVLVSTPKAFQNAQLQHPHLLAWSCFGLVIFDEVHHVLKEHPYRQIASHLRNTQLREQHSVRVLGLTASLTYQVSDAKVKAAVQSICSELEIKHMATATLEELRHAGYHAASAPPEVLPLQLPQDQLPEGLLPVQERQPHLLLPSFLARVKRSQATPFSMRLMACISAMEAAAGIVPASSPVQSLQLREWGKWAKKNAARSPRHFAQLEHWYEALRVLVVSWEEAEDAAVTLLRMFGMDMDTGADVWPAAVRATLASFWAAAPPSYPRFDHLKDVLLYKLDQLPSFRCLLFVQQRVMTHILEHVISSDPELRARLRPACIYATTSPATASLSVTASASKERLAAFAAGAVNLLISTVGRGRARQADSSFVVLSERADRPAALLVKVEAQQNEIVSSFQPADLQASREQQRATQRGREHNARSLLHAMDSRGALVATLNEYVRKTKASLEERWEPRQQQQQQQEWTCSLVYTSVLRSAAGHGSAQSRKPAKAAAAAQLIEELRRQQADGGA